jgi:hypothetical protein
MRSAPAALLDMLSETLPGFITHDSIFDEKTMIPSPTAATAASMANVRILLSVLFLRILKYRRLWRPSYDPSFIVNNPRQ